MSSGTRSARERFVESLAAVLAHVEDCYREMPAFKNMAGGAIDAFADFECEHTQDCPKFHMREDWDNHLACRAALRKEIGL